MTNFETAKELLYHLLNDIGIDQNSAEESKFLMLLELASKPDYKFPENNEFPNHYDFVIAFFKDVKEPQFIRYMIDNKLWVYQDNKKVDENNVFIEKWVDLSFLNKA